MSLRFLEPAYALLLLPIALGLIFSWRRVHGLAKPRKAAAFALRALMAALLTLALMGPQIERRNSGLAVMFVVDRSDSIPDGERRRSEQEISRVVAGLPEGDLAGVVSFGRSPVMESLPGPARELAPLTAKLEPSATDPGAAIRLAAAAMPEGRGRRIVLYTDANETAGDMAAAAEAARQDGIMVDIRLLGVEESRPEAAVLDVQAPVDRRLDEPFDLRVVVESTVAQSATLVIDRDGQVTDRLAVQLSPGRSTILVPQRLTEAGFRRYRATLEPAQDSDGRNNVGASFVSIKGRPKVLVLQGPRVPRTLAEALRQQGIEAVVRGPEGAPAAPEDLQGFDAVFLNDINAADILPSQMALLQQAVRGTGVGLAMVGGEDSFLPGGWYGTPVEAALPVSLDIRQRRNFPSTSVLIMVDASGSMSMIEDGVPKIRLAAQGAESTARLLTPRDRLGVAGSTDGIDFVLPMSTLTDVEEAAAKIRRLSTGGGGIYARPTIAEAERVLMAEKSQVRHFILLADGADTEDYGDSLQILARMRAAKITTTVVAIGDGPDVPWLKRAAAAGGGSFFLVDQARKLPAIFTQDVSLITRSAIEEGVFVPRALANDPILRGVADAGLPALYAYCLADARPLARTVLESPKGDPILAVWQYGLGSSLAFMSDAQPRWAAQWAGWDGFSRFWAQAARSVARRAPEGRYGVQVDQSGGRTVVRLEAQSSDGAPLSGFDGRLTASLPDGTSQEISLIEEGPGQYSGELSAAEMGSYILSVSEPGAQGGIESAGFAISYPPEYRAFRSQPEAARLAAEAGGGQVLADPAAAARPLADPGLTLSDVWLPLVLAALILLPADVMIRRVVIPWPDVLAWLRRKRAEAPVEAGAMDRLRTAKARAAAPSASPNTPPSSPPPAAPAANRKTPPPKPAEEARAKLLDAKRRRRGP